MGPKQYDSKVFNNNPLNSKQEWTYLFVLGGGISVKPSLRFMSGMTPANLLVSFHGSQAFLFDESVSRHWWGWKLGVWEFDFRCITTFELINNICEATHFPQWKSTLYSVADPGIPTQRLPTPEFGVKTYYLARFLQKTAWKWMTLDWASPWIRQLYFILWFLKDTCQLLDLFLSPQVIMQLSEGDQVYVIAEGFNADVENSFYLADGYTSFTRFIIRPGLV